MSALSEPRTDVPASVMLTSQARRTDDTSTMQDWATTYCAPEPPRPDATAMRTRSFEGPETEMEAGPLRYTQQVAAFATVEDAVAEAGRFIEATERCRTPENVLPSVLALPVGTQSRLVVFSEGGYHSIGGYFRRGNAVAVVQGQGGTADEAVRDALHETFDRMCIYDRPAGC